MKATGIIRRVDDMGRIVIPYEVRRSMGIHYDDTLEFFIDPIENIVCLKKYSLSGEIGSMLDIVDSHIECIESIKAQNEAQILVDKLREIFEKNT